MATKTRRIMVAKSRGHEVAITITPDKDKVAITAGLRAGDRPGMMMMIATATPDVMMTPPLCHQLGAGAQDGDQDPGDLRVMEINPHVDAAVTRGGAVTGEQVRDHLVETQMTLATMMT